MASAFNPGMHVITGTSGTGKSVLLEALLRRGHRGFYEPIRATLEQQLAVDGPALPSNDSGLFIRKLLDQFIDDHNQAKQAGGEHFFDRGLPDLIAYANRFGVDAGNVEVAAKRFRYSNNVFVLPPWSEIFEPDGLRRGSFVDYEAFHSQIIQAYVDLEYRLILVPKVSVVDRVAFIESALDKT